ncbi:MAG: cytochrome-c peroxidase [Bacteroidota bacterium]|jgi:cytochrome c peroxidase
MMSSSFHIKRIAAIAFILLGVMFFAQCSKEPEVLNTTNDTNTDKPYTPTPYIMQMPLGWSMPPIPVDNPLTVEGVELGRKLFYDPILSRTNTISCASCHNPDFAFTDNGKQFSSGVDGISGKRNSMPLFNLAWVERFAPTLNGRPVRFFWDGGASTLEAQALAPIIDPIEMNESLTNVIQKLQNHPLYPGMFKKAFGSDSITTKRLAQAIAQFERTIISSTTKHDRFLINPVSGKRFDSTVFSEQELRGLRVFSLEEKGDCFHCHNHSTPFTSDFQFHHNGHRSTDSGLYRITLNPADVGKFRTPSLRNLVYTAPYMHDGRFKTLEEVVEHYDNGVIRSHPTDPLYLKHPEGLQLSAQEKADLVAFLKTMTDSTFFLKPQYRKP